MQCKTCNREAGEKDFGQPHLKAYDNIIEKYAFWRKGLNIPWEEYLSEITKNSLTGEWAKKAAKHLISNEEEKNVKEI